MTSAERAQLLDALTRWAASAPEEPVVGFIGGGKILTPREIVWEVRHETDDGIALLEILEHGIRREGIEMVTGRLNGLILEA